MADPFPDEPSSDDLDLVAHAFAIRQPDDGLRHDPPAEVWAGIEQSLTDAAVADTAPGATITNLADRRRTRTPMWLAVAASIAALAVGGWWIASRDSASAPMMATELTNNGLSAQAVGAHGQAEVRRQGSELDLDIRLDKPPSVPGSYLEVWMIDTAVDKMVSLGPFHGDGTYPIPAGYDPAKFPIVDISIEPPDGQPKHSSISALRGVLAPPRSSS